MPEQRKFNNQIGAGIAAIGNLDLVATVLERLSGRHSGLPGLGVLHGPAGWGKTFCANEIAKRERGYFVQMTSCWRSKTLLEKILFEMGVKAKGTTAQLLDEVCDQLATSKRPLIIDEFDHCAKSDTLVELVRDIYEGSQGFILLIGEEGLPRTLEKWERFHSRVLAWAPAQPASIADAELLSNIYCPGIEISGDLIAHLVELAKGSVRRVSVNLTLIYDHCMTHGEDVVDLDVWGDKPLYTGKSPERRTA